MTEAIRELKPADFDKEIGSAVNVHDPLFEAFDNGAVFDYDEWDIADLNDMLRRDGKARALEAVLTLPTRGCDFDIVPNEGDSGEADEIKELLMTPANNGGMSTPLRLVVAQMTSAFYLRKSYHEKVLTHRDGKVAYDKIAFRPAQSCRLRLDPKTGGFRGFEQDIANEPDPAFIKPHRAFVYLHGTHRDPIRGISDLEVMYWAHKTKQKIRYLWYIFLQSQSMPKTLVKGDDVAGAQEQARRVASMTSAGVLGMEKRYETETIESNGRGADVFMQALRWLDGEAAGSVLAGFTELTSAASDGKGSFALSKDQSDFYLRSREAVNREIEEYIDNYLIADLVKYNRGPSATAPSFKFEPLHEDDVADAVTMLQSFAVAPNLRLPDEFMEDLAVKVADHFDFEVEEIRKAMKAHAEEMRKKAEERAANEAAAARAGQVGSAAGAVGAAAQAAQRAQEGKRPVPNEREKQDA